MTEPRKRAPKAKAAPKAATPTDALTDRSIAAAIDAAFGDTETISAATLADILGKGQKNLRAYMRTAKLRDQAAVKGNAWKLSHADAAAVASHYESAPTEEA